MTAAMRTRTLFVSLPVVASSASPRLLHWHGVRSVQSVMLSDAARCCPPYLFLRRPAPPRWVYIFLDPLDE